MSTPEPVLDVSGLEVRYGSIAAVRGLDLSVEQGEIVGLIGPNGAGSRRRCTPSWALYDRAPGDVRLRGLSIRGHAPEKIVRAGIALVPEGRRIYAELTVEDNLRLGLSGRRTRSGAAEAVAGVFELFPIIEETRRRHAGLLSGGQQQQLAIGRALVAEPDVLLLDEPSLGLAPTVVDTVFEALRTIRERGVTILLVEQRAQRTVALADRTRPLERRTSHDSLAGGRGDTRRMVDAYFGSS